MMLVQKRKLERLLQQIESLQAVIDKAWIRQGLPLTKGGGVGNGENINAKVFKIIGDATGDGVYACQEQRLLSAEWDDTDGDEKFEDLESSTTFTANPTTDIITVSSAIFSNDDVVYVSSSFLLPSPLEGNTPYYVINVSDSTLQLSETEGGSAINITSSGIGTHTIYKAIEVLNLSEHDPSAGQHNLSAGNFLLAVELTDNEDNKHWVGINPDGGSLRRAKITSLNTQTVDAKIDDAGDEIEVKFNFTAAADVTKCIPKMRISKWINIYQDLTTGDYYGVDVLQEIGNGLEVVNGVLKAKIETQHFEFVSGKISSKLLPCGS